MRNCRAGTNQQEDKEFAVAAYGAEKRLNESQQLLRSTNKSVKSQLANLNVLSGQIEQQQKYIVGIEGEVNVLNGNIGQLTRELHKLQQELADCKLKYSRSVMYMYRNRSTQNKLMFLFSSKNFSQMFRRLRYVMDYAKYQRAQGEVIKIKEKAVHDKRNQLLGVQAQKMLCWLRAVRKMSGSSSNIASISK